MLDSISFPPPFCFAHFLHVTFHSACSIRVFIFFNFYPRYFIFHRCGIDDLSEFNFSFLSFVGRLLKTRRGQRKESRDVTTLQGEQVLTLSKCRGVPNNTLSPLKLGSYPKVFASPRAALAVGKLFNNSRVRTYHFVNNRIRKSAQMCFNTRNLWVLYRSLGNCLLEISHPRGGERKTNVAAYTPYDIIGRFTSE